MAQKMGFEVPASIAERVVVPTGKRGRKVQETKEHSAVRQLEPPRPVERGPVYSETSALAVFQEAIRGVVEAHKATQQTVVETSDKALTELLAMTRQQQTLLEGEREYERE